MIEELLVAAITPHCADVFPDVAPDGATGPYVIYGQAGGVPVVFVDKSQASKKNGRFQIDAYAPTRLEASAMIASIAAALCASSAFQAEPLIEPIASFDDDAGLYRSSQDFSIWSDR